VTCAWKPNWAETQQHFIDWWNHEGTVLTIHGLPPVDPSREPGEHPGLPPTADEAFWDFKRRCRLKHHLLAAEDLIADTLPLCNVDFGPGSLATVVGSEPVFAWDTVWFEPTMPEPDPEGRPPIRFDPESKWTRLTEDTLRESVRLGEGKYMVGCIDLIENIDTLASLRGTQNLLTDLVARPDWVLEKLEEINQAFFEAYDRIHEIIRLPDGSCAFGAFGLWGHGKVVKVQCDASAMFSPAMFERFVVPALTRQCEWLDRSMFHLDGHQCIGHLDALLAIDALDAIEWTPDPQVPGGGDPRWFDMYRRILDAGKSVQAIGLSAEDVERLLDNVGAKGMYFMASCKTHAEAEALLKKVDAYR